MIYEQSTGLLKTCDGLTVLAHCYSGAGVGKNNPDMQKVKNVGPVHVGWYTLGTPLYTGKGQNSTHGPYVIPLEPDPENDMDSRGGFLIHGDSMHAPGTASEGCVIPLTGKVSGSVGLGGRPLREAIYTYAQTEDPPLRLQVITGPWPVSGVGSSQGQVVPT